jgi:hypothetical protein
MRGQVSPDCSLPARAACILVLIALALVAVSFAPPVLHGGSPAIGAAPKSGATVSGAEILTLSPVGQVGGATFAVAANGRYVYFGVGPRLVVVDVDDPKAPRKVGETAPLGGLVRDVVVVGTRAVVALGKAGVAVVDIADATHPQVAGGLDTPGYAWEIAYLDRVYVADGPGGLLVVDLTGSQLRQVGSIKLDWEAFRVAATEGYAYAVVGVSELYPWTPVAHPIELIDVRQPGQPRLVELDDGDLDGTSIIAVANKVMYAVSQEDPGLNLKVLGLTDPTKPRLLGTTSFLDNYVNDISVQPPYVGLAMGLGHPVEGSVMLFDVSDPAHPRQSGQVWVSSRGVRSVVLNGNRSAAALPEGGIATFDVTDEKQWRPVGRLAAGFEPANSAVSGDTAYVAAGTAGLATVDVSAPAAPALASLSTGSGGGAITDYGHIALAPSASPASPPHNAYVTSYHGDVVSTALRVFDLTGPGAPREVAISRDPWTVYGALAVTDGHAFVVGDQYWPQPQLRVFDIARAITPTLAATLTLQGATDIAVRDRYAYVPDAHYGLYVLDVRDPVKPRLLGGPGVVGIPTSVSASDQYVVVGSRLDAGANQGAITVFNRSDPGQPKLLGSVELPERVESVAAGDYWTAVSFRGDSTQSGAWLESDPSGVYLVDLSDPSRPSLARRVVLPGAAAGVTAVGQMLYVSMQGGGLQSLLVMTGIRQPLYLPMAMRAATNMARVSNQQSH